MVASVFFCAGLLAASPDADALRRVGVLSAAAGKGVPAGLGAGVEQMIEAELRKRSDLWVVSASELRDALGASRQRQLLGCKTDDCLGAGVSPDVDELVITQITKAGARVLVTLQRFDTRAKKSVGSRTVSAGLKELAVLLSQVAGAAAELIPARPPVSAAAKAAPVEAPKVAEPVAPAEPPAPAVPPKKKTLRVALLEPRMAGDVPPRVVAAFGQSVTPEVRKLEGVSAISSSEIADMLGVERQKQLLGCSDGASECWSELAGAVDADELVTVDLALVGSTYVLSARRTDMRAAKVLSNYNKRIEQRDGEELLAVVGPMVEGLYPERPLKPGRVRGVEEAVVKRLNPPPLPRWAFGVTLGVGVAAALGGGTVAFLSGETQREYRELAERSVQVPVEAAELATLEAKARTLSTVSTVLLVAAGGVALVAIIEAFFTDWRADAAVWVAPVPGGGQVGASVRF